MSHESIFLKIDIEFCLSLKVMFESFTVIGENSALVVTTEFQSTAEMVHEDRSDGLVSEPIDERTQTSGEDTNKHIQNTLDS